MTRYKEVNLLSSCMIILSARFTKVNKYEYFWLESFAWTLKWASLGQNQQHDMCAQSDQSLRWAHMPLCWFCHETVQIMKVFVTAWLESNNSYRCHGNTTVCQRKQRLCYQRVRSIGKYFFYNIFLKYFFSEREQVPLNLFEYFKAGTLYEWNHANMNFIKTICCLPKEIFL